MIVTGAAIWALSKVFIFLIGLFCSFFSTFVVATFEFFLVSIVLSKLSILGLFSNNLYVFFIYEFEIS